VIPILQTPLKLLAGALGVVLVFMAAFLYPDEREKLQNHLEDAWIKIRDKQGVVISKHVAFMQAVGTLTTHLFERVFGKSYISARAITVSICLSLLSFTLIFRAVGERPIGGLIMDPFYVHLSSSAWIIFVMLLALSVGIPRLAGQNSWVALVFTLGLMTLVRFLTENSFGVLLHEPIGNIVGILGAATLLLLLSFGCDMAFVAVTRSAVRRISNMDELWKIVSVLGSNVAIATGVLIYPLWWAHGQALKELGPNAPHVFMHNSTFVILLSLSNSFDILIAAAFVIMACAMLIHRMFWPLLARPIYALAELGIRGHRRLLGTVGMALVGIAAGKPLVFLAKLIEVIYKQ
jgi:hypothetical protein